MISSQSLAVVGAINVDLVVSGASLPRPGETVVGGAFARHHGGKGGNQAVAAARALQGTHLTVAMIGAVGDDEFGSDAVGALRAEGIVTDGVASLNGVATGVALIVVDKRGENQISVASGASASLTGDHVRRALDRLAPELVLISLEIPQETALAVAAWSRDRRTTVVLNPAPAQDWALELLDAVSLVTPNELERAALGDLPAGIVVVETHGAEGVAIHEAGSITRVDAPGVDVVDTTGAGDCLNGVLAVGLLEGLSVGDATTRAVTAAALSVTVAGAREGMPTRTEIDAASRNR